MLRRAPPDGGRARPRRAHVARRRAHLGARVLRALSLRTADVALLHRARLPPRSSRAACRDSAAQPKVVQHCARLLRRSPHAPLRHARAVAAAAPRAALSRARSRVVAALRRRSRRRARPLSNRGGTPFAVGAGRGGGAPPPRGQRAAAARARGGPRRRRALGVWRRKQSHASRAATPPRRLPARRLAGAAPGAPAGACRSAYSLS